MEFSLNFVNSFLKIALTCSQLQSKKMPAFSFFFFSAIFRCRGIIVLLLHEKLIFCVYICNISSLDFHFGVNEVARMRFINAGGPNEALWSIFRSLFKACAKALMYLNFLLRRSWGLFVIKWCPNHSARCNSKP